MPAPQAQMLDQLSRVNFSAKGVELPDDWKNPGDQFDDAFAPQDRQVPPNPPLTLFHAATLNKLHVETAKKMSDEFSEYIKGATAAICASIDQWMKAVTITGVIINGPTGILAPGGVVGPPIGPSILSRAPKSTPVQLAYSQAIANTLNSQWQAWHMGLSGTLLYPAFAAFPGPMAPPTPNVPVPLVTLTSPGQAGLSPSTLKSLMLANFTSPQKMHADVLFESISKAFNTIFTLFTASTLVQNVLGTGPIPTFAPPFVPVGPVLAGTGTGAPGCLV